MISPRLLAAAAALLLPVFGAQAQATAPAAPVPAASDVASIDAIIAALYASISGPAGQPRQWDRMRSLMAPSARLVPTGRNREGQGVLRNWSVEEYIAAAGPSLERDGFFEREIGRSMQRYGNVVHLLSAYDSKRTEADPEPFQRGVNSIQLWFDGQRWFVVSIFWEAETAANPIPAELLRGRP